MSFHEHRNSIEDIKQYVPDKYRTHFDEVVSNELKKTNLIPADQPKYAVWKFVRQVDEPKPSSKVYEPQPKQPSVEVPAPEIPARQQVDVPVHEEPEYDYGWQEPRVAEIPNTGFQYPRPKNPWDIPWSGFGF